MGLLKGALERLRNRKSELATAQQTDRIHTLVHERKKTSNERELERIMESRRQERITEQLRRIRKAETRKVMTDNSLLKQKNIFKHKQTMLNNNNRLFNSRHNNLFVK